MAGIQPPKVLTQEELTKGLLNLPSMVETKDNEYEHVILYGPPGTGKTTLAGLLSEYYYLLWFDGDKGLTALRNNLHPELLKRIRPFRIPDSTANPLFVSTMLRVITGRQVNLCHEHGLVDCTMCSSAGKPLTQIALNSLPKNWVAVMDSQTQFVASAMAATYYKINPSKIGKDVDDYWRGSGDEVFAFWGGMRNVVEKFGNYVKDLECPFISISHDMIAEDEMKVKKIVPIAGSEAASLNYAKYFGTEIRAKKVNRKIYYITSAVYSDTEQSKSRSNVKLEEEAVPSLIHVFRPQEAKALLKGSYNEWFFSDRKLPMPKPKEVLPE